MTGCITVVTGNSPAPSNTTPASQPPVAVIDDISPSQVEHGNSVTFTGSGSSIKGTITAYEWKSNLDGVLSSMPAFSTNTLAVGTHTISFKVQDNASLWSEPATGKVVVTPEVVAPSVNYFKASPDNILAGSSSVLSWEVENATQVSIDNGIGQVETTGFKTVYPSMSTVYKLTAVNDTGTKIATAEIQVQQSNFLYNNPVISYFTASFMGNGAWELKWNVTNATEVNIDNGIGPVDLTGSTVINTSVTKTFTLTATNDWGWAKHSVTVGYQ